MEFFIFSFFSKMFCLLLSVMLIGDKCDWSLWVAFNLFYWLNAVTTWKWYSNFVPHCSCNFDYTYNIVLLPTLSRSNEVTPSNYFDSKSPRTYLSTLHVTCHFTLSRFIRIDRRRKSLWNFSYTLAFHPLITFRFYNPTIEIPSFASPSSSPYDFFFSFASFFLTLTLWPNFRELFTVLTALINFADLYCRLQNKRTCRESERSETIFPPEVC